MSAMKKKNELKGCSPETLIEKASQVDREIFVLRNELSCNRKMEKPHMLKHKRKEKARILTMLTIKQRSHKPKKEA